MLPLRKLTLLRLDFMIHIGNFTVQARIFIVQ